MRPVRLILPCPRPKGDRAWGDYYFGQSLATSLQRLGHRVTVICNGEKISLFDKMKHRLGVSLPDDPKDAVDLVLRGKPTPMPKYDRPRINWLISQSDQFEPENEKDAVHTFVASPKFASELEGRGMSCSVLLQCTDPSVFSPEEKSDEARTGVLFVGNRKRIEPRPVVEAARDAGLSVSVWGSNWEKVPGISYEGHHIPNSDLGKFYASAGVVLNDHRTGMLRDHFMSNRVFDVLASGRPVVTEAMVGIPDELRSGVFAYSDLSEVGAAIEASQGAEDGELLEISKLVRSRHGFDQRAAVISECIASL